MEDSYDPNQTYYGIVERGDFAPMTDCKWKQLKRYLDACLDDAIHKCGEDLGVQWTGGDVLSDGDEGEVVEEDDCGFEEPGSKKHKTGTLDNLSKLVGANLDNLTNLSKLVGAMSLATTVDLKVNTLTDCIDLTSCDSTNL